MTREDLTVRVLAGELLRCRTCGQYYLNWQPKPGTSHWEWTRAYVDCWSCTLIDIQTAIAYEIEPPRTWNEMLEELRRFEPEPVQ